MKVSGYSFLEMVIVIVLVSITATGVIVNLPYVRLGFDAELAAVETLATIDRIHRAALSGSPELSARSFNISQALHNPLQGVVLTTDAPASKRQCQNQCRGAGICVSATPFCYKPSKSFTFEQYSGRLKDSHAVFVVSKQRSFAVLISSEGHTQVAELINSNWELRDDIRMPESGRRKR